MVDYSGRQKDAHARRGRKGRVQAIPSTDSSNDSSNALCGLQGCGQIQAEGLVKVPYPLTILLDRYSGCYSGGRWTAWNLPHEAVPGDVDDDDVTCMNFWTGEMCIGRGDSPEKAVEDLLRRLEECLKAGNPKPEYTQGHYRRMAGHWELFLVDADL